jgi:hypothetical protein
MSVYALHEGIQYQIDEIRAGEWRWSFVPPTGANRSGEWVANSNGLEALYSAQSKYGI